MIKLSDLRIIVCHQTNGLNVLYWRGSDWSIHHGDAMIYSSSQVDYVRTFLVHGYNTPKIVELRG